MSLLTQGIAATLERLKKQGRLNLSLDSVSRPTDPSDARVKTAASDAISRLPLPSLPGFDPPPVPSSKKKRPAEAPPADEPDSHKYQEVSASVDEPALPDPDETPPLEDGMKTPPPDEKHTFFAISPAVPDAKMATPDRILAQQRVRDPDKSHLPEYYDRREDGSLPHMAKKALKRTERLSTKTFILGQSPLKDVHKIKSGAAVPTPAGVYSISSSSGRPRYWALHHDIDRSSVIPIKGPGLLPLAGTDVVGLATIHEKTPAKPFREILEEHVSPIPRRSPAPSPSPSPIPPSILPLGKTE